LNATGGGTDNPSVLLRILTGNPFFASCLAASGLLLIWRLVYRERAIAWPHILFPPLWSVGSTFVLGVSATLLPMVLDRYLYAADGAFGFQPSFAGARLLLRNPWLLHTCAVCYFNLPVGMTAIYLLLRRRSGVTAASQFIRFAIWLAVAGAALYFVFPAVGPGGAFNGDFPNRAPAAAVVPIFMPMVARNCMPSLHTAWILCMLWCAPPMGRRWRAILWAFSAFTLLYALSAGGHYLVDLVVAVPFARAVQAGLNARWKSAAFVRNAALVGLWFVLLRFGLPVLTTTEALPYALALVTVAPAKFLRMPCRPPSRHSSGASVPARTPA
jgi:hypothetical protein